MKPMAGGGVDDDDGCGALTAGASVGVTGNAMSAGSIGWGTSRESFFSGTDGLLSTSDDGGAVPDVGHA